MAKRTTKAAATEQEPRNDAPPIAADAIEQPAESQPVESTPVKTEKTAAFTQRDVPGATASAQRISIKLSPDGTIDFESMRDATAATFKAALAKTAADAKNLSKLGLAPTQQPVLFPPQFCEQIYDGIGKITGILYVKATKVPPININVGGNSVLLSAEVARTFEFTPEEKSQLGPVTARVLSKHAPATLAKYSDEIQLAWTLASITAAKVDACNRLIATVAQMIAKQAEAQKAQENEVAAMAAGVSA